MTLMLHTIFSNAISTDFGNFFAEMLLREYAIKQCLVIPTLLTNVCCTWKNKIPRNC